MVKLNIRICLLALLFAAVNGQAYWEWTPGTGRWINPKYAVRATSGEQFAWAEELRGQGLTEKSMYEHKKLLKNYPGSSEAPESCFILAGMYMERGDKEEAYGYYARITETYPGSSRVLDALKAKLEIAEERMERPSFRLFQRKEKGDMLAEVLRKYPYMKESESKSMSLGRYYLNIKDYESAKEIFSGLAERTMDSSVREEAHFNLIKAEYGAISSAATDTEGVKKIRDMIAGFNRMYSESRFAGEIMEMRKRLTGLEAGKYFEIASYYERAGKKKAAQYYYRIVAENYPDTDYGKISRDKIGSSD